MSDLFDNLKHADEIKEVIFRPPDAARKPDGGRYHNPPHFAPLARRTDPATSHEAVPTAEQRQAVLRWAVACVKATPGKTQRELGAIHCPGDLRKIGRRLNEGAKAGLLRRGPVRKCTITFRRAGTWWPVEASSDDE